MVIKHYWRKLTLICGLCLSASCSSYGQNTAIEDSENGVGTETAGYRFTYKESEYNGTFDPFRIDAGSVYAIKRTEAYKKFIIGEYEGQDLPYRNLRINKAEQFLVWNSDTDEYNMIADLSAYDYGCANWLYINNKVYFVAMGLNDERYFNEKYDHGWCAPYDIVCIENGNVNVLDSCKGMAGAQDVPGIYEYEDSIYYLGSDTEGIHRIFQFKRINTQTNDIEVLDTIEFDAEVTAEDALAARKVCGQAAMTEHIFTYVEHTDDRKNSIIHEYCADTGVFMSFTVPLYVESAFSLKNYIFMNTTDFNDENHTFTTSVQTYNKTTGKINGTNLRAYQRYAADLDEAILFDQYSIIPTRPVHHFIDTGGQYGIYYDRNWLENSETADYWSKYMVLDNLMIDDNDLYIFMGGSTWNNPHWVMIKASKQ